MIILILLQPVDRNFSIDAKVYGNFYGFLGKTAKWFSKGVPLPEEVLFLDVDLETALERNAIKVCGFQHHLTRDTLSHIITQYREVLDDMSYKGKTNIYRINTVQLSKDTVLTQAMNIIDPIITEAKERRSYFHLYSENSLKESIAAFIELGRIEEKEAEQFLEKAMRYRSLLLHMGVHSAIGLATPTGIGAPISMIARPLWTFVNMVHDKIKKNPYPIHNIEVALLSSIPMLGNFSYLVNLTENPEMFDFYIYHLARHVNKESLEGKIFKYVSNPKVKDIISKGLSYTRTNYETPFVICSAYGIATNNLYLSLIPTLIASGILSTGIKKNDSSLVPRAMRMSSLILSSYILQANGEYIFSNSSAMTSLSLLTLAVVGFTIKAARSEEAYRMSLNRETDYAAR